MPLGDQKKGRLLLLLRIFWEKIPQVRHVLREKEEVEITIFKPYVLARCQ
jgi:hypothetical protein